MAEKPKAKAKAKARRVVDGIPLMDLRGARAHGMVVVLGRTSRGKVLVGTVAKAKARSDG